MNHLRKLHNRIHNKIIFNSVILLCFCYAQTIGKNFESSDSVMETVFVMVFVMDSVIVITFFRCQNVQITGLLL